MSVKDLTSHLRENPDHLKPVIVKPPLHYKGIDFYDELFAACREVYEGQYPIYGPRLLDFLGELKMTVIAERENIPNTEEWYKRVLEAHPEYDYNKCFEEMRELFEIDGKKGLRKMSNLMRVSFQDVIGEGATYMRALRVFGFEPQVELCLRIAKNLKNPILTWHMVNSYYTYLLWPFSEALGGFVNYNLTHLENMAFLRLLPFRAEELRGIRREAFMQSPSARSLLQKEECRINVFRGEK